MHVQRRGSGEAILFIHGMPTSNQLWGGIIERMCGKFTCLAIDLPGLGQTPCEPYRPDYLYSLAERIDSLRIQQNITKWNIVGHDAGSAIAVHYVCSFQPHVIRLALLAPAIFPDLKPYYLLECLRKRVVGECLAPFVSPIFWNVAMRLAARNEEATDRQMLPAYFREPFSGFGGAWRLMRVMRWGKPSVVLAHVPGILPQISVPTVIFHGSRDPAVPPAFGRRAQMLIPNSQLVPVNCGHFIPLNRPEFMANELERFFSSGASASKV